MSLFELALKKSLLKAAEDGDVAQVEHLVEDRGVSPSLTNADGWGGLHYAAMRGNMNVLMYLIGQGVSVTETNRRGMTPLHMAAFHDNTNAYEALLKAGASSSLHQRDDDGNTPYQWKHSVDKSDSGGDEGVDEGRVSSDESCDSRIMSSSSATSDDSGHSEDDAQNTEINCDHVNEESLVQEDLDNTEICDNNIKSSSAQEPEVEWMSAMLSRMTSTTIGDENIVNNAIDSDDWSDTSSSMSESDLIDPYSFSRTLKESDKARDKVKSDKENDIGVVDGDEVYSGSNSNDLTGENILDSDLNDGETRCCIYTVGGVQYDWTNPLSPPPSIDAESSSDESSSETSEGYVANEEKSTGIDIQAEVNVTSFRGVMVDVLRAIHLLRRLEMLDNEIVGRMKDNIFSGNVKLLCEVIEELNSRVGGI